MPPFKPGADNPRAVYSDQQIDRFRSLRAEGWSIRAAAWATEINFRSAKAIAQGRRRPVCTPYLAP